MAETQDVSCFYLMNLCLVLVEYEVDKYLANKLSKTSSLSSLLFKASQGDIGHAVGLLTTQPAEVQHPGKSETSGDTWEAHKGTEGQIRVFMIKK